MMVFLGLSTLMFFRHAINPDDFRAHEKLNNTPLVSVVGIWLINFKFLLTKYIAINFSCHHDFEDTLKLLGHHLLWSPMVKILCIWFT